MKKQITLLLMIPLLACINVLAFNIIIDDINEQYELPRNRVNCVIQDSNGFLWFGMVNGLYKFDLNSFTEFNPDYNLQSGYRNLDVKSIVEISPGRLMIGVNKGLYIFDTEKETFDTIKCHAPLLFSDQHIQSICVAENRDIWIGSENGIIIIREKGNTVLEYEMIKIFDTHNTSLSSNEILEIKLSPAGTVWFLSSGEIGYYNKTIKHYTLTQYTMPMHRSYLIMI